MTSISVSQREEMKKEIKEFLISGNYEHEFAILTDNSMSTLKAIDLIQIYQILIKSISAISSKDSNKKITTRPICPIKGVKEMSKARIVYKIGMINYLEQFGIHLTENAPCNYSAAILEALANYFENNMKSNNESVATQGEEIDK